MGADSPIDVNDPVGELKTYKEHMATKLLVAMNKSYRIHEAMNKQYKRFYDRKINNDIRFRRGDRVYLFRPKIDKGKSRSLSTQYIGPLRILDLTDVMAKIVPYSNPFAKAKWVALKRLKLVTENYVPSYRDTILAQEFMETTDSSESENDQEEQPEPVPAGEPENGHNLHNVDEVGDTDNEQDAGKWVQKLPTYNKRKEMILDAMSENQANREAEANREVSKERYNSRYNLRRRPLKRILDDLLDKI